MEVIQSLLANTVAHILVFNQLLYFIAERLTVARWCQYAILFRYQIFALSAVVRSDDAFSLRHIFQTSE